MFWIAFIGYLPVVAVVGMSLNWVVGSEHPAIVLAIAWMGFVAFACIRMSSFPCPRCGKPFFYRGFARNPLVQRCMRCDWPKWVEPSASSTAAPNKPPLERTGPAI
jgi:hypothetical protein